MVAYNMSENIEQHRQHDFEKVRFTLQRQMSGRKNRGRMNFMKGSVYIYIYIYMLHFCTLVSFSTRMQLSLFYFKFKGIPCFQGKTS